MGILRPFSILAVASSVLWAASGSADVPPPDACMTPGSACRSARDPNGGYDAAGTCVSSTCTRYGPLPEGGVGNSQYACSLCVAGGNTDEGGPSSGASSGSSSGASSGSSSGSSSGASSGSLTPDGAASPGEGAPKSGCGCADAPRSQALGPLALTSLGALVVVLSRRRRNGR